MKMPNLAVASQVGWGRASSAQILRSTSVVMWSSPFVERVGFVVSPWSVPQRVLAGVRNPDSWCDAQYRQHRTASGSRERYRQAVGPPLERQRLLLTDQLNGCDGRRKMRRAFGEGGDQQSSSRPVQRDGVDDVGASGEPDVFSSEVGAVRVAEEGVDDLGRTFATDRERTGPVDGLAVECEPI